MRFTDQGTFAERPSWATAPAAIRCRVEEICDSPVAGSRDVHGGMSPGPAAVLRLRDGRSAFVKAVSRAASGRSFQAYVREAVTLAAMPRQAPAPTLIGYVDADGWFALVMSVAPGEPAGPPWTAGSADLVAAACETLARIEAPGAVPRVADLLTDFDGWQRLATGRAGRLDGWERRHAATLARLAAGWQHWTAGQTLVHQDIRADNAVVDRAAGRAVLVDWGYGCAGAEWLDRARLAADIVCSGHHDGSAAGLRTAIGILDPLPADAARYVVALAGMWRYRSTLPALPGQPTLRHWQRARAWAMRPLLAALIASSDS